MQNELQRRSFAFLNFFKEFGSLRRKPKRRYSSEDVIIWFSTLPKNCINCHSVLFDEEPSQNPELWLRVKKIPKPELPKPPPEIQDWLDDESLRDWTRDEPLLRQKIRVQGKELKLEDHPEVEDKWLEYVVEEWLPWAEKIKEWQTHYKIFEKIDYIRRRLEEAEERYEFLLGFGLLEWQPVEGKPIQQHLLIAPAEVVLDADRGVLEVLPSATFDGFRLNIEMLDYNDRKELQKHKKEIEDILAELDIQIWDLKIVNKLLGQIANFLHPGSQIDIQRWTPTHRLEDLPLISFSPALILRERRFTAYEEFIDGIESQFHESSWLPTPWKFLVFEGDYPEKERELDKFEETAYSDIDQDPRLYFPLKRNREQEKIAELLRKQPFILVKGPPGTGKSQTIANLITHLLAKGERVLVTAQSPRALTVLNNLLPETIRPLCVTFYSSTREDIKVLDRSLTNLLEEKDSWQGEEWAKETMSALEEQVQMLEKHCADIERKLMNLRKFETEFISLQGGYQGSAADIAKRLEEESKQYRWFPELITDIEVCPLWADEIEFLAEIHSNISPEKAKELELEIGEDFGFLSPTDFQHIITQLRKTEQEISESFVNQDPPKEILSMIENLDEDRLKRCDEFLKEWIQIVDTVKNTLGDMSHQILHDSLFGDFSKWEELYEETAKYSRQISGLLEEVKDLDFVIPSNLPIQKLFEETSQRLKHLQQGGRKGWWIFAPKVVRKTRYIERTCHINGHSPVHLEDLQKLLSYLQLKLLIRTFSHLWWSYRDDQEDEPLARTVQRVKSITYALSRVVNFGKNIPSGFLKILSPKEKERLLTQEGREQWAAITGLEVRRRRLNQLYQIIGEPLSKIRNTPKDSLHPLLTEFEQAIKQRDPNHYKSVWDRWKPLSDLKHHYNRYKEILEKLEPYSPDLVSLILHTQGEASWKEKLLELEKAWSWAAARRWMLQRIEEAEDYQNLNRQHHHLKEKIQDTIAELAAHKAKYMFFSNLEPMAETYLKAWKNIVQRLGKGLGKRAYRLRREARKYLMRVLPNIPAWVMPIHKVWENVNPVPGIFDTVIVDESSQAGIDALPILFLGKKIVIVGDDKQNSPEAVGILEDDIQNLISKHFKDFTFKSILRPDVSLYDIAYIFFRHPIKLREHFRCVPEIIHFSNQLCYTENPLIPLRQPPPGRLDPIKTAFVRDGYCEGSGANIVNHPEVEEIVQAIEKCIRDEQYKGKTLGVISLQGHKQSKEIERKIAQVIDIKERETRKLRCGEPSSFQGDERDVIFISLVVAPNHRYRALTGLSDIRRFNVAMSRARDQVWIFHSVKLPDLSKENLRFKLLEYAYSPKNWQWQHHYDELKRLEKAYKEHPHKREYVPKPYESWFEVEVAIELLKRGYRVIPQFETAGYRLDLIIEGLDKQLAVECDGDIWHGEEKFLRDLQRQWQLERVGWTFVRIRYTEFKLNKEKAIQKIIEECERLGILPFSIGKTSNKRVL